MNKSIIIIGAGMGGMSAGIYGQLNGFDTVIYEANNLPGGQCTSWNRKGYKFDVSIHSFNGFSPDTRFNDFWKELGVLPCEMIRRNEFVSAVLPDGTYFHNYFDIEKLESHLKTLSPEDAALADEYIHGIKLFKKDNDWFGILQFGSFVDKLPIVPYIISLLKYFKYTMRTFGKRFKHPLLQKAFPLLRYSEPDVPLFGYLAEHSHCVKGDIGWPRGGSLTVSKNMADRYINLGGTIHYGQKAVKILTDKNRACGVELEDGTQHKADFVISNADGRKTIMEMLEGRFVNKKISRYCKPNPDIDIASSVTIFLGVKRDLSGYPAALIMFLDKPEVIAGYTCDHLGMQIYGFDASMAPAGKGVIKIELFSKLSYFSGLYNDKAAYKAEKNKIAEKVISLLEKQFPGLRQDIEVIDISTLKTWERFMGGSDGHFNYPNKYGDVKDIRNIIDMVFGLNKVFKLPGLKNFFFTGQWVTSMGSLALNALSGQTVIQKICRKCRRKFNKALPVPQ